MKKIEHAMESNMEKLSDEMSANLKAVKSRMAEAEAAVLAKSRATAKATDDYVHESPWQVIGVAAVLSLAIGWLIGRR